MDEILTALIDSGKHAVWIGTTRPAPTGLVVIVAATSVRIEGVDVETAAQLVARLR